MAASGHDVDEGVDHSFTYHRALAPGLIMLLGLALLETAVLHLVASGLWGWPVAVPLGLVDLAAIGTLMSLIRSLRRRPVTISRGLLVMRLGWLKTVAIPLDQVAGLGESWDAAALKTPAVLNLALVTWPNVVVELGTSMRVGRRAISAVAHKLDDRDGFAATLAGVLSRPTIDQAPPYDPRRPEPRIRPAHEGGSA